MFEYIYDIFIFFKHSIITYVRLILCLLKNVCSIVTPVRIENKDAVNIQCGGPVINIQMFGSKSTGLNSIAGTSSIIEDIYENFL